MQLSARGAQKKRDESKKLVMYSKQWLPGDTLRVFYPIYWEDGQPEILVGAVWGHNVSDIKGLGLKTSFIPSTTDFDQDAQPIGVPDITYQFSKIARAFVNGQKAKEEESIMKKNWPTEAARKNALKDLEDKFDTKNNMKAIRPIIGPIQYYITTEVLSIKLANGMPVADSLTLSSAPLSGQTITRLYTILQDPKYAPQEGDRFLEVEWKYPTDTDKGNSSKAAAPAGLTPEYRFQASFPDAWIQVQNMFGNVAVDSETMSRRATRKVDPNKVRQALTQYSFANSEYLDAAIDEDIELLCKHADLIKELDIRRALTSEQLIGKIDTAIAEYEASLPEVTEMFPNPLEASASMPTNAAAEVEKADEAIQQMVEGAPSIDSLLGGGSILDQDTAVQRLAAGVGVNITTAEQFSDDGLEDIDLTSAI